MPRVIVLKPDKSVRLQTEGGSYLTVKAKKSGALQIVNYRTPLFDWHGDEIEAKRWWA